MVLQITFIAIPVVIGLCVVRKFREYQWGRYNCKSPLTGKVFLITGSNSGIGKETAKRLAERNACVIMACRDKERTVNAINEIRQFTSSGILVPMQLDLSSFDSIRKFAEQVLESFPKIHVLINNAGVSYPVYSTERTIDGFEMNFGVNHLGHFLLTHLLIDRLKESAPSRVVVVSSRLHERGIIDLNDLNMQRKEKQVQKLNVNAAYSASKLANVYHARELAKRLKGSGVDVNALCPGFTYTNLFRHFKFKWWFYIAFLPVAFFNMRSSQQAAQTVLFCATNEKLTGTSGEFFRNCKMYHSNVKFDVDTQEKLWQKSEELCNIT